MNTFPIPVTIITGFLGAGKTTFLNQVIRQHPDKRFAIIENEFGDIGIDSELVIGARDGIFELSNGCICCTVSNELNELLFRLATSGYAFDHLLIETTGIADPASVAAAFLTVEGLSDYFRLDGVICLVDAFQLNDLPGKEKEMIQQISYADVLLLNKCDLVADRDMESIRYTLGAINPGVEIRAASYAGIDTTSLLSLNAFDTRTVQRQTGAVDKAHDFQHGEITSQSYVFDQPFDMLKFRHFIQVLLLFQGMRIYRMKGILFVAEEEHKVIFQSVRQQMVYAKGDPWQPDESRQSKLVIIGNGLKRDMFEKRLKECLLRKH